MKCMDYKFLGNTIEIFPILHLIPKIASDSAICASDGTKSALRNLMLRHS